MLTLTELLDNSPVLPYIRESDFAVRLPWFMHERRLLDYLLIYIQEGTLRVTEEGVATDYQAGEFCLLQPGTLHMLEGLTHTITPFAHLDFFYHSQRKESFPTKAGQTDLTAYLHLLQPRINDLSGLRIPSRFKPRDPFRFKDTMLRMVECWNRHDPLNRLEAQSCATELIIMLLQDHAERSLNTATSDTSLKWMTAYLHMHLAESITIEEMASRANLSPSRFRTVFKQQFGQPPHQYLLQLRLRHACELLLQTKYPLHTIAEYCGFADLHHFSKIFRKHIGDAPGAYRKARQQAIIFL
ncbi:helix-turn-helix domain-containing protein [Candidatus Pristimantibacillus sp. PTI5]|uniref:helix-turn-helix domain-containing protein n=1 Tax=Candidatus Pristimantibacillus sp. PTI5 TaxID=3400422 RepID=UPI003B025D2F